MKRGEAKSPPSLPQKFLRWYCPEEFLEELQGDLHEEFQENLQSSRRKATLIYWLDSIGTIVRYWFASIKSYLNHSIMIKNYLKTTFRVMWRHRFYSILNVVGLALGLACCLFIFLYVNEETSFDKFHQNADRLHRLNLGNTDTGFGTYAKSSGAMAPVLIGNYPEIEAVIRLRNFPSLVANGDTRFYEDKFYFTDSSMMTAFSWKVLAGNPETALTLPNSLVVTEQFANKYFPGQPALGKQLLIDNQMSFRITAIVEAPPRNSHLQFDALASTTSIPNHHNEALRTYQTHSWYAVYYYSYLLLKPGVDVQSLGEKLLEAPRLYSDPEQYQLYGRKMGLYLQPIKEIHLDPKHAEILTQGNSAYIWIFSVIAMLILLVACVNYLNLVTARASTRLKEIGLRKAIGASRRNLKAQFAWESIFVGILALLAGWAMVFVGLPLFNLITDKQFLIQDLMTLDFLVASLVIVLMTAVIGGVYPAFYLSKFRPALAIKGQQALKRKSAIRKIVVVLQFSISISLIAATMVIYQQTQFMLNKDLGLTTEQVVVIPTRAVTELNEAYETRFKSELEKLPSVVSSAIGELSPGEVGGGIIATFEGMAEGKNFKTIIIGEDYLETYDIELLTGRDYSSDITADSMENVIINLTLAQEMGWTAQEAIGKKYDFGADGITPGEVIGVTADFHFRTLHTAIVPTVFAANRRFMQKIAVKLDGNDISRGLADVKNLWQQHFPQFPFEYYFADDNFSQLYHTERKFGRIFLTFSGLAVLVALLGLIGLTAFFVEKRLREFGIRKIMGATEVSIFISFSKSILNLLLVAILIAIPAILLFSNKWLATFSYRTTISFDVPLIASAIAAVGCLLVLIWQSMRLIYSNPAEVLRND